MNTNTNSNSIWLIVLFTAACMACLMFTYRVGQLPKHSITQFRAEDYYALNQGNSWTYRVRVENQEFVQKYWIDGTEQIGEEQTVKFYFSDQGYKCFGYPPEGIMKYKEFDEERIELYSPPGVILPNLQMYKLQEYRAEYVEQTHDGMQTGMVKGTFKVKLTGLEDVRVRAGLFEDCLRIEYIDRWEEHDGSFDSTKGVLWFAKGVGRVKDVAWTTEYDSEEEEKFRYLEVSELISMNLN